MIQYEGGCHCGNIKFTATGELQTVVACNCSICSMHGSLHWIVAPAHFSLLSDPTRMSTYTFHRHIIRHHFCPTWALLIKSKVGYSLPNPPGGLS